MLPVDGHDRCLVCLGYEHTRSALVDGSCALCERMVVSTLRSRLSFLQEGRGDSSVTTCSSVSVQEDLRFTVRASSPGTSSRDPRSSCSSQSIVPVKGVAAPSVESLVISFGAPPDYQMSVTTSEGGLSSGDEESVALPPSGVAASIGSDPEITAMFSWAAVNIGLSVKPPPSPETSQLDNWCIGRRRSSLPPPVLVPFFPDVHRELTRSWQAPYSARLRSVGSAALTTLDDGAARGYVAIPQVEKALTVHLCPQSAATWRNRPRLLSKTDKSTASFAAKAYSAADHAPSALHAMAILQVHQAKVLKKLQEGSADPSVLQELREATDFALHAMKVTARSLGQTMATLVAQERHLWLGLAEMSDAEKVRFLDAPISQAGLFGDVVENFTQEFSAVNKQTEAIKKANLMPWGDPPVATRPSPAGQPRASPCVSCPSSLGNRSSVGAKPFH